MRIHLRMLKSVGELQLSEIPAFCNKRRDMASMLRIVGFVCMIEGLGLPSNRQGAMSQSLRTAAPENDEKKCDDVRG